MAISRLPSQGLTLGSPPKLHGQAILQLQLSATVAEMCQFSAARGGVLRASMTSAAANSDRMPHYKPVSVLSALERNASVNGGDRHVWTAGADGAADRAAIHRCHADGKIRTDVAVHRIRFEVRAERRRQPQRDAAVDRLERRFG